MRFRTITGALALAMFLAARGAASADDVRLSGCLVRGQDGDGYLVTNVPGEAAWQRPNDAIVAPGPVGTSGTVASVLYWLEKKAGLEEHVGQYVEIEGKLQGDLQDGHIKVTPKEQWTRRRGRSRRQITEGAGASFGTDHPGERRFEVRRARQARRTPARADARRGVRALTG